MSETPRKCGARKISGTYLVSDPGFGFACKQIPYIIERCPTCGGGIKFGRGFEKIIPQKIFERAQDCKCVIKVCPLKSDTKSLLGWVGCLSDDTEILTINGWKKHNDIKIGDSIFTLNINTQKIEQSNIDGIYVYDYSGEMLNLKANGLDILVTPNHRMVTASVRVYDNSNTIKYSFKTAEEIEGKQNQIIPVSSINEKDGIPYSDDFIKLCAWIITEGSMDKRNKRDCDKKVFLYQRMSNIDNITNILKKLSIQYTVIVRNPKTGILKDGRVINGKEKFGQIYIKQPMSRELYNFFNGQKMIPPKLYEMNKRQFDLFIETMIEGDGRKSRASSCHYFSGDKLLIDELQMMLVQYGYKSYSQKRENGTYFIGICKKTNVRLFYQGGKHWFRVPYEGTVWCAETKNQTLIIRRNGTVCIVGNSKFYTPESFAEEAVRLGVSKRIAAVPRDIQLGRTWIFLAHHKAGFKDNHSVPAVFYVFKPSRIERIVTEAEFHDNEKMDALRNRGITPVAVPDTEQHRGSVFVKVKKDKTTQSKIIEVADTL